MEQNKVILDLEGLDGNAFAVMGAFKRAAKQQGWDAGRVRGVIDEAMSGDYNHLLRTIMKNTEPSK